MKSQSCQSVTAIMIWRISKCSSSPTELVSYSDANGDFHTVASREVRLSNLSSISRTSFPQESKIWHRRGSLPSLFAEVIRSGRNLSKPFIPRKARIPTAAVAHPSRIYSLSEQLRDEYPNLTHKDPGPSQFSSCATHEGNAIGQDTGKCAGHGRSSEEQPKAILELVTWVPKGQTGGN
jgi:hypothetical protein